MLFLYIYKKKSMGCNWVFDQVLPGHIRFFLPLFFLQPSPESARSLIDPPNRVGFQNYDFKCFLKVILTLKNIKLIFLIFSNSFDLLVLKIK